MKILGRWNFQYKRQNTKFCAPNWSKWWVGGVQGNACDVHSSKTKLNKILNLTYTKDIKMLFIASNSNYSRNNIDLTWLSEHVLSLSQKNSASDATIDSLITNTLAKCHQPSIHTSQEIFNRTREWRALWGKKCSGIFAAQWFKLLVFRRQYLILLASLTSLVGKLSKQAK